MSDVPQRLTGLLDRATDLEVVDADRREIVVRAVPYEVESEVEPGLFETFTRGAFAAAARAPHRVKLFMGHSNRGGSMIGHATGLEDRDDGPHVVFKIAETGAGNDARALADNGSLDKASVEFKAQRRWLRIREASDGMHVRHDRASMYGVALVPYPAHDRAEVLAVRAEELELELAAAAVHEHDELLRSLRSLNA